ncbi:MAG: hypothetical protein WD737_11430 [Gemmatimonadota bacterium]
MLEFALAIAFLLQVPADTASIFDSPETEALVVRAIANLGEVPSDLQDYRAQVQTTMQLSIASDTLGVADLPATVDELVSSVRWARSGHLRQEVIGHRMRVLVPLPYTLATIFETPWVIPHLYGIRIYAPLGSRAAVNPFGASGPRYYQYQAGDTLRVRLPDELLTLVPISIRPRHAPGDTDEQLVIGTFYLDASRAAVARARMGFAGRERLLPRSFGQVQTFLELENGLWEGRFWLPFRQRRDILFESSLLGGAVTARVVNRFLDLDMNTGWQPSGDLVQLDWNLGDPDAAFADWRGPIGDEESELAIGDFADLQLATSAGAASPGSVRAHVHYDRGSHLFRYNRVEGAFVGLGGRLIPADPRRDRWELYATGGWAISEGTARGEIAFKQGTAVAPTATGGPDWGFEAAAYRRLRDIQPFRPTFMWDWFYTLPAVLWGADPRDYYDATGAELSGIVRQGRWSGRTTLRLERHDSVTVNTQRFLFGTAAEFEPLAGVRTGDLLAVEAGGQYSLGPGAFGIGNSLLARVETEVGMADFSYRRATGLVSIRYALGPLTLAARADGGHAWGATPPQKLFRFGSVEGLRGFEPNEFGGSTALLGRARFLIGLPPRSARPLARAGLFLVPPLRPNLVLLGETGWTDVTNDLADDLARLGARPTDGFRSSVGLGISFFDDAVTVERLRPLDEERAATWYVGLTYWY